MKKIIITKQQILSFLSLYLLSFSAFAEEMASGLGLSESSGFIALGAGLAIGMAALGGALAQGRTTGAAMEGLARNPQARDSMFVPMIIGLALIESLVIYALVISFFLIGKI